ncbi:hypothetical protein JN11_01672 [Mucilaginibacter frigoritolerans]|jgi:hypothetical protein|uniref:Uncharacterized protein n=1 Tax=Mucilaginibacter frigoritolerans TaxID=652788 RepID=A0A562U8K6_9SPHI|nr:hypothetical protein [Mucilaginibacter frigoritolerans]TWJ01521.1 hypothetical protein JN11_01672 [Mucilaginibacter frigoritolerans]
MRMLNNRKKLFFAPFAIAAFAALIGFVVMGLWNYLLPGILHVGTITFWQALGIFILCKILFGFGRGGHRFGGNGGAPWMRRKMEERFRNMSPEEKEKFKEKWEQRCGVHGRWRGEGRHPFDKWNDFTAPEAEKTAE